MYKETLKKYLDDLAAEKPAPGGGSAAALTAAVGAALLSMVCNFTLGKEKYKAYEIDIRNILTQAEKLRAELLLLVDADVAGYKKLSAAYQLPVNTPEEKKKRAQAVQDGLKEAVSAPLNVCKCCREGIKLAPALVGKGNVNLISDVGVAVFFLEAAYQAAMLNVDINLRGIKDKEFILKIRAISEPLGAEIEAVRS
ncbi:MAG: cyclodeaminase/cyclohydrolase family protein, partial [Candidatus Omnitrophota bacterium]